MPAPVRGRRFAASPTAPARRAYELRGQSLAAIELEAARLCGKGYEVLRQSQRYAPPEGEDNATSQWLLQAGDWLSGMPGNQAQATVVCHT